MRQNSPGIDCFNKHYAQDSSPPGNDKGGDRHVGLLVAIEVGDHQRPGRRAAGEVRARTKGPVPIAEQHADVAGAVVGGTAVSWRATAFIGVARRFHGVRRHLSQSHGGFVQCDAIYPSRTAVSCSATPFIVVRGHFPGVRLHQSQSHSGFMDGRGDFG